jgi:hypothetical protein
MKGRFILEGIGASLLFFTIFQILYTDYPIYIHPLPVTNLLGGFLVGILITAAFISAVLFGVDRLPENPRRIVLALFAGFMIWRLLDSAMILLNAFSNELGHKISFWDPIRIPIGLAIVVLSLICGAAAPRFATQAIDWVRLAVAACAFSLLAVLPRFVHDMNLRKSPMGAVAVNHDPALPGAQGNRVIWILFDELSYDQTFDHRQPGIDLPTFDRLRAESFSFSNIKPIGYYTEYIVPSLFLGKHFEAVRRTPEGQFFYKSAAKLPWTPFNPRETIFDTAREQGWTTGIEGWLIPYCRFMGSVTDRCFWTLDDGSLMEPFGASEDKSMLANAAAIPRWAFAMFTGGVHEYPAIHLANYEENMSHARELIDDSGIRFLFLHMSVPHPPGIYDRRANRTREGGSYLDNLVLADQTAAELLSEIEATPAAGRTTLIVSSDHSLRLPMWKADKGVWTSEDEAATGGRFDTRPVLLVHFPGQASGQTFPADIDEMLEHDILDAMLRGQMGTATDLEGFLEKNGVGVGEGTKAATAKKQ